MFTDFLGEAKMLSKISEKIKKYENTTFANIGYTIGSLYLFVALWTNSAPLTFIQKMLSILFLLLALQGLAKIVHNITAWLIARRDNNG